MDISNIAMNRMLEERAARDKKYRRDLERDHRPLLSHGRAMSDEQLLAKLSKLGFDADREHLMAAFPRFISAQSMAETMIAEATPRTSDVQTDWVWIALTRLWERWQPELANIEMLDDTMQAGYAALAERDAPKACRLWLRAWRAVLDLTSRSGDESLDSFDSRFGGTNSVFNWVQDLEIELHNAGLDEPQFFRERIAFCETVITRFSGSSLPTENFQAALAQSHFELGEPEAGDRLFRRWLDEHPQWGGGWIAWADGYWLFATRRNKDAARAEEILREGLAVPDVEDRRTLLERLAELCKETGRSEESAALRQEIQQTRGSQQTGMRSLDELPAPGGSLSDWPADSEPGNSMRTGRNEPCPCGSGKKFKKCCGRRAT